MIEEVSRNEIFLGCRNTNLDKQQKEYIESLRRSVCEVQEIAKENIRKVTEREEKISMLSDRIDNLKETTQKFSDNATKLRNNTAYYYKIVAGVAIMCFVLMAGTLVFSNVGK
uniref:V-SNARE coiled-coil homology domain-containing protein n=1 Tax=Parastrongyloides trichosuri TaxID=131310 RepID=A0A0N4ZMW2_PARTI